jgi:NAD(P)-dependent dehydrogenase (short-subunit alcohol dehydrogenase family)
VNLFSLQDRVALVTGGGRGIGRGIAEGFAAHGARVVCAARTQSQLDETVAGIRSAGGEAQAVQVDMANLASVKICVEAAIAHYGRVDILVNNAGMNVRKPVVEATEEDYDRVMAVNLKGIYFLTQAVVKDMISRKRGKVINIGSLTTGVGLPRLSIYGATKGGVGQLTKAQALEFAEHNIQVNALCPGFVLTPLTAKIWEDQAMRAWVESRLAQGRLATPKDMAGTAVFLASEASDYVTGQCIYVDGGFMAGEPWPFPDHV